MNREIKLEEVDESIKEALKNFAEIISTTIYNIDILYELLFAAVKYPTLILTKDENGNVIDVELKMPKLDQDFLNEYAKFVFDVKDNTRKSEVITPNEINRLCEQKIEEMLKVN